MYAEITKNTFQKLLNARDIKHDAYADDAELARTFIYFNDEIHLTKIINYVSCVTQYYIRDINA